MRASAPFKMTLFADLHFEEVTPTDWSPLQDINSTKVMDTMLNDETLGMSIIVELMNELLTRMIVDNFS